MKRLLPFLIAAILASCSSTKYVPEGSWLLDRVEVATPPEAHYTKTGALKSLVRQSGNSRWFGALKIPLAIYSLSGRDSMRWHNRVLRRIGEAPVLYDSARAARSLADLTLKLQGEGYLGATGSIATADHNRKRDVLFTLAPGEPYHIGTVAADIGDTAIAGVLAKAGWRLAVRSGSVFNADLLAGERSRLTDLLQHHGYYRFNKDFIHFQADTVQGTRYIDLTLRLEPWAGGGPHPRYVVGSVRYRGAAGDGDSLIHLSPRTLRDNTFITPNAYYDSHDLNRTYNRFGRLQAVRYTGINFAQRPGADTLDCTIAVSANRPNTISFTPEGTNTAGDLGAAAKLAWQNRNIFHGSEVLSLEARGAYEAIRGLDGYQNENYIEYNLEARLLFPRFIVPFLSRGFRRRNNATSELSVSYNQQQRPEYHRRVLSLAWRYKWADASHHDRYQLDLLDLNYVSMPWISETFRRDWLDDTHSRNAILRYNYENLFIMKLGFTWWYSDGTDATRVHVESAGNLLAAASKLTAKKNELGLYQYLGVAYAQYAKIDLDYTRNIAFDYAGTLALHIGLGLAYPYGNSRILPFEKRYFSGGANSVRGWSVRELGPGSYGGLARGIDFINQTGDMKLDLNAEYRAHLFWKFQGALFLDGGNIWTLRDYPEQPGGQFHWHSFWREIAAAYGLGLRLNFDYFILRLDFGMKAINPAYSSRRDHYPITHPRLSRDLTFHFAVGMPF